MSYIVRNERLIGKTEQYFNDEMLVWCCNLGEQSEAEINKIMSMPLLRRHPTAFKARISNDALWEDIAKDLCFSANVRSVSPLSLEVLILTEPCF